MASQPAIPPAPVIPAQADVVVAGSGAAGLTAALAAATAGADVLLIERAGQLGGTTALSGGGSGYQRAISARVTRPPPPPRTWTAFSATATGT